MIYTPARTRQSLINYNPSQILMLSLHACEDLVVRHSQIKIIHERSRSLPLICVQKPILI